jgi:hypothetical protein
MKITLRECEGKKKKIIKKNKRIPDSADLHDSKTGCVLESYSIRTV